MEQTKKNPQNKATKQISCVNILAVKQTIDIINMPQNKLLHNCY